MNSKSILKKSTALSLILMMNLESLVSAQKTDMLKNINLTSSTISKSEKFLKAVQKIGSEIFLISASAAVSLGMYKLVFEPKNNLRFEELRKQLSGYLDETRSKIDKLDSNNLAKIQQLEENIRDYILNHSMGDSEIERRLTELVSNIDNLKNEVNECIQRMSQSTEAATNGLTQEIVAIQDRIENLSNSLNTFSSSNNRRIAPIWDRIDAINASIEEIKQSLNSRGDQPIERSYKEALALNVAQGCKLCATNGATYIENCIDHVQVDIGDENSISAKLAELCIDFDKNIGILDNPRGYYAGWERPSYTYFFEDNRVFPYSHLYNAIDEIYKAKLAKCIVAMYQNKDDPEWYDIINNALVFLSKHDGHCSDRAKAMITNVYGFLVSETARFSAEHADLMEYTFSAMKNSLLESAKNHYHISRRDASEPLGVLEGRLIPEVRSLLGMNGNIGNPRLYTVGNEHLSPFMTKRHLLETANEILRLSYGEDMCDVFFTELYNAPISFKDYCKFSGKSHDKIESLINKISSSDIESLKDWAADSEYGTTMTLRDALFDILELYDYDDSDTNIPEIKNRYGFMFMIKCFKEKYFEDPSDEDPSDEDPSDEDPSDEDPSDDDSSDDEQ